MTDLRMLGADRLDAGFVDALTKSVSHETAYPAFHHMWSPENPFAGNCLVASLLVWWRYGGTLMTGRVDQPEGGWHFRNRLDDGMQVDVAWSQYGFDRIFHAFTPSQKEYAEDMQLGLREDGTLHRRLETLLTAMARNRHWIDANPEDIISAAIRQTDAIAQRGRPNKEAQAVPVLATA